MKLFEVDRNPSPRKLREFGLVCLVSLPLIGWAWGGSAQTLVVLAISGLLLGVAGITFPAAIKPIFRLLSLVTFPTGIVVGELAMLLLFFGVVLPVGLCARVFNRDALQLHSTGTLSLWKPKYTGRSVVNYYRQW